MLTPFWEISILNGERRKGADEFLVQVTIYKAGFIN